MEKVIQVEVLVHNLSKLCCFLQNCLSTQASNVGLIHLDPRSLRVFKAVIAGHCSSGVLILEACGTITVNSPSRKMMSEPSWGRGCVEEEGEPLTHVGWALGHYAKWNHPVSEGHILCSREKWSPCCWRLGRRWKNLWGQFSRVHQKLLYIRSNLCMSG